jgi:hypothetical protein
MADQGPTALGQDAPQIEAGARSSADTSREQAAPDFSPLKGAKLVPHGDAKANLRAQIQSELHDQGVDTSALSNQAPSPMPQGPPPSALVGAGTDETGGPVLAENPSNPVVSHNVTAPPPSALQAVGESAAATGKELGNGLMRGALTLANGLGFGLVAASHVVDAPDRMLGRISDAEQGDSDAKIFDFLHNYIDAAKDYWTVKPEESNPYAQGVGQAAEALAPLAMGGEAAIPAFALSGGIDAGKDVIDQRAAETAHQRTMDAMANGTYDAQARREGAGVNQGVPDDQDVHTAVLLATIAAASNAVQAKFLPLKNPGIVKRIAGTIGLGELFNGAVDVGTKAILKDRGFQTAADKIDPTDPQSIVKSGLMNAVFAVLHKPEVQQKINDAKPPPPKGAEAAPNSPAGSPPPPATPPPASANAGTEAGASSPPVPAPSGGAGGTPQGKLPSTASWAVQPGKVADQPTAEPVSDLRAQFKDMGNAATPRNAVFISVDNAANLKGGGNKDKVAINNQIARAEAEDRTVDTGNGTLIVKSKKLAADATARLKAGEDPQVVIGELTGAGTGKRPDQSHVVQGQTPEGAVVNETSVAPHEIPAAVEAVKAQGNEPVITTPQEAVQRRAELVQQENQPTRVEPAVTERPAEVVAPAEAAVAPIEKPVEPPAAAGPASVETPVEKPPVKPASEAPAPEQKAPVAKPAAAPKFDKQKVDIDMKRVNAEEPEDMSREEINSYYNRVRGIVGDTMPKMREIFPDGFNEDTEVTDAVSRAAREALEAKHATEELPSAPVAEPATKKTPKAVKPKTGMESLQAALTQHEMLDTPRDGRRFATSLEERKENGANFGAVLEQAAKEMATEKPEESARALAAAKKMTSWYNLGENAVVKGQGISHTTVDAVAKEAHSAARELLGKGTEADRPTGLKVSEIRANAEVKADQRVSGSRPRSRTGSPRQDRRDRGARERLPVEVGQVQS